MTEPIEATPDLRSLQIRVYYDPAKPAVSSMSTALSLPQAMNWTMLGWRRR